MFLIYIQLFRVKVVGKCALDTVPDIVAVEPTFVAFLWHSQTITSMVVRAILSNLFEE